MKRFESLIFVTLLLSSCSLKYGEEVAYDDVNPQFVFGKTEFTRYENHEKKANVSAEKIEKYKKSDSVYAQNGSHFLLANLDTNNSNSFGKVDSEGECGLLFADNSNGLYELYDSIRLFSQNYNASFYAKSLKFNSKNEQLVSGRGETVRIEKKDTAIYGSGFSASGVTGNYSFTGTVSGELSSESDSNEAVE